MQKNRLTEQEITRINKLEKIRNLGFQPYLSNKKISHSNREAHNLYSSFSKEELESKQISLQVAGRIMFIRSRFYIIRQDSIDLQLWMRENLAEKQNLLVELLDIGDIIWAKGVITKSNKGMLMLRVEEVDILTKALKPLPEKFKGLKNIEDKYRKRYLDLIFNQESREVFITRSKILTFIRNTLDNKGFLEVDTPVLQPFLGGANAKPFTTFFNALKANFVLRVATELPLKKLLVGDLNKVYEIGRIFRNEGVDSTHNPEFTSIEFYQAYCGLEEIMNITEELIRGLAKQFSKDKTLEQPFRRIQYVKAVSEKVKQNLPELTDEEIFALGKEYNIKIEPYFRRGHVVAALFEELVEPTLVSPTFVTDYPIEISPLARIKADNPRLTERAELFIYGKEVANMFGELNDPIDQLQRFELQVQEKTAGNSEATEISYDFLEALNYGMPPAGGCGIGIERLIMVLTNTTSIKDVILFPQLKTKN